MSPRRQPALILLAALAVAAIAFAAVRLASDRSKEFLIDGSGNMKILSPAFDNNELMPSVYTCDGQDISPPLTISGTPERAKSLVLVVDDPDAAAGTWTHWTMWNIDPATAQIAENAVPAGAVQGRTSFGAKGYGGPCPPSGTHHYFFKIYALDAKLKLPADSTSADLERAMNGHILDKAGLVGLYRRG